MITDDINVFTPKHKDNIGITDLNQKVVKYFFNNFIRNPNTSKILRSN